MEMAPQPSEELGRLEGYEKLDHIPCNLLFGLNLVATIQLGQ